MAQGFRARMNNFHSVLIEVLNTAHLDFLPTRINIAALLSSYQVGSSRGERRRFKAPTCTNHLHAAQEDNPLIFLAPVAAWAIISSVAWLQLVGTILDWSEVGG